MATHESDGEHAVQKYTREYTQDNAYDDYNAYNDYYEDDERLKWTQWAWKLPFYYVLAVAALIIFTASFSTFWEDGVKHFLRRSNRASRARAVGQSGERATTGQRQQAANIGARSSASQRAYPNTEVDGPNSVAGAPHKAASRIQPDSSLESQNGSSPENTEPHYGGVGLRRRARGSKSENGSDESAGDRVKASWTASERDEGQLRFANDSQLEGSLDPSASDAKLPDVSIPSTDEVLPRQRAAARKPHDRSEESARDRVRASWSEFRIEPQQVASKGSADVSLPSSDDAGQAQMKSAGLQTERSQNRATRTASEVPWIVHTPESFEGEQRQRQRRLKEAQDAEYEASLQADREKELARQRAEEEEEQAEARKQEAVRILGAEPDVEDACTVKLVLPNNVRLLRRFLPMDSVDRIFYSVVAETGLKPSQFTIKRSFIPTDSDASQAELKFDNSGSLTDADIRNFDTLRVTLI